MASPLPSLPASSSSSSPATLRPSHPPPPFSLAEMTSALVASPWRAFLAAFPYSPRLLLIPFLLSNLLVVRFLVRRLLPFVASKLVAASAIRISSASIGNPQQNTIDMAMKGSVSNAGPIHAVIRFNAPVKLAYEDPVSGETVVVGEADGMPCIDARGGRAVLDAKVHVRITDPAAFGVFSRTMVQQADFELVLVADDITVLVFGVVPIHHVTMRKKLAMKGLNGLRDIKILNAVATQGTTDYIRLSTTCEMRNPSDLTIAMGDVALDLFHEGMHRVGSVEMRDLILRPGLNVIKCSAKYAPGTPDQARSGRTLLGRYVTGEASDVTIRGSLTHSTPFAYLAPALASLNVAAVLPGETRKMIRRTQLVIDPFRLATLQSATRLELSNPMQAPVSILWMKGRVVCRGEIIGNLDEDLAAKNAIVVVPPQGTVTTATMGMRLRVSSAAVAAIMAAGLAGGGGSGSPPAGGLTLFDVDVESTLGCRVGDYSVELDYRQEGVPVGMFG
ncbi:hypothetical protein HDU86_002155 [Geranomyces michiganensis]|nr:hypothetical protein HDU86_002155 [Geranomyces michiganensis]